MRFRIDGVVTGRNRNATGNISNTRPVSIAGKGNCDQVEITCDYFSGDIDHVRIETSWPHHAEQPRARHPGLFGACGQTSMDREEARCPGRSGRSAGGSAAANPTLATDGPELGCNAGAGG